MFGLVTAVSSSSSLCPPSARGTEGPPLSSLGALEGRRAKGTGDVTVRLPLIVGRSGLKAAGAGDTAGTPPFGCCEADASAYWACRCDMARVVCRKKDPGLRAGDEAAEAARVEALENWAAFCPRPNWAGCGGGA